MNDPSVRCENIHALRWVSVGLFLPIIPILLIRYSSFSPILPRSLQELFIHIAMLIVSTVLIVIGLNGCKRCSASFGHGRVFAILFLIVSLLLLLPEFKEHFPAAKYLTHTTLLRLMLLPFYALFGCSLAYSILSPCAIYSRTNGRPNIISTPCNLVLLLVIVFIVLATIGDVMFAMGITTIAFIDNLAWRTLFNRSLIYAILLFFASLFIFLAQYRIASNWVHPTFRDKYLGYY